MSLISIGNIGPLDDRNVRIGRLGDVKQEKINTVWGGKHSVQTEQADSSNTDKYNEFKSLIKDSPIRNKSLSEKDLLAQGYKPKAGIKIVRDENGKLTSVPDEEHPLIDMNGGKYYINEKTGEEVRICEFENSNTYTKGDVTQTQFFDENGNPSGGKVVVKGKDGINTEYRYETDINGNKFLTGVKQENRYPADFSTALKESSLGDKFQSPKDLEAQGWVKESYMDMNGGVYYRNPKTGDTVRVMEKRLFGEGKTLSVKTDKMAHFAKYDDDGNETGGIVQVKQDDGSIKIYKYTVDQDGVKSITSEEMSDLDYFAAYE